MRGTLARHMFQGTHGTTERITLPLMQPHGLHSWSTGCHAMRTYVHTTTAQSTHHRHVVPVLVFVLRGSAHRDDLPVATGRRSWGRSRSCVPRCTGPGPVPGPVLGVFVVLPAAADNGTHGAGAMPTRPGGSNGGMGWRRNEVQPPRRGGRAGKHRAVCSSDCTSQQCHHPVAHTTMVGAVPTAAVPLPTWIALHVPARPTSTAAVDNRPGSFLREWSTDKMSGEMVARAFGLCMGGAARALRDRGA